MAALYGCAGRKENTQETSQVKTESRAYDDVHEMFESPEEIPAAHSLLGLRLGRKYFVDIWDQEPYGKIKEYGKNILLIHGDRDSIVPVAYSDRLAETVDNVEYHVIKGGGQTTAIWETILNWQCLISRHFWIETKRKKEKRWQNENKTIR